MDNYIAKKMIFFSLNNESLVINQLAFHQLIARIYWLELEEKL